MVVTVAISRSKPERLSPSRCGGERSSGTLRLRSQRVRASPRLKGVNLSGRVLDTRPESTWTSGLPSTETIPRVLSSPSRSPTLILATIKTCTTMIKTDITLSSTTVSANRPTNPCQLTRHRECQCPSLSSPTPGSFTPVGSRGTIPVPEPGTSCTAS